jgi:hypothetical protein
MSLKKKNNLKEEKENKYKLILNDLYDIKGLYNLYLNHKNEKYNFPEKSKLKSMIFNAFKMNNEKELYDYFYNEYLNSEIDNHDLKALTKVFIFFIEKEIINKNENENLKNSSLKLFYSKIIDSDINNINSYLILFNIKSEFINSIDENNFIDPKFLNLIQELELQNKIDYHKLYIKKLNLNLINLLKEINKILLVYDLSLSKIIIDERKINVITNLNNMIDYNILNNDDKMEKFHKTFLGNMDKILNKLDILIDKNKKNLTKKQKDSNNINFETKKCLTSHKKNHKKNQEIKSFILNTNEKANNKILVNRRNFSNQYS